MPVSGRDDIIVGAKQRLQGLENPLLVVEEKHAGWRG
jgi:hypothetical protein